MPPSASERLTVTPVELRRVAAVITDDLPEPPPPDTGDPGWATTAALSMMTAAAATTLGTQAQRAAAVADALRDAADAYERCDDDNAQRIRAAARGGR